MKSQDRFETTFSFELFPPKTPAGMEKLQASVAELNRVGPRYFSVTYGAGGSTRERTFDTVEWLRSQRIDTAPHLSCIGSHREEILEILRHYMDQGIHRIVALRGDLPGRFSGVLGEGGFRYLMEKGIRLDGEEGRQYLLHDPCHSPMKTHAPLKVASELVGRPVTLSDRCCGEAGTLGTARPDIANQLRFRKAEELRKGLQELTGKDRAEADEVKMLTACPACQQGLSRYADETGLKTDYIVVELARSILGEGWQQRFFDEAKRGGIERVLL